MGASEKKGVIHLDGLEKDAIQAMLKYFWDNINNTQFVSRNLITNEEVRIIEIEDIRLLVFHIPVAKRTEKPVYLSRNPFGNTLKTKLFHK